MKPLLKGILTVFAITAALALLARGLASRPAAEPVATGTNVTMEDGRQIVTMRAKGGYAPEASVAKAGLPTTLRVVTSGTYDCSSVLRIPSLGVLKNLPATGTTDFDLGTPNAGPLRGSCGMGMYPFSVTFE